MQSYSSESTAILANYENVDRLANIAGSAPVPHDSGRISGNLKRRRRYDRRLLRACYLAAYNSLQTTRPQSRAFYDRKRRRRQTPQPSSASPGQMLDSTCYGPLIRDETIYQPVELAKRLDKIIEIHSDETAGTADYRWHGVVIATVLKEAGVVARSGSRRQTSSKRNSGRTVKHEHIGTGCATTHLPISYLMSARIPAYCNR